MVRRSQIEEDVVAETEHPAGGPDCLLQGRNGGQGERRASRADQHRGDGDVQPVDGAGVDEAGHGEAAALDEETAMAEGAERRDDVARSDFAGRISRQLDDGCRGWPSGRRRGRVVRRGTSAGAAHHDGGRRAIAEQVP